MKLSEMSLDQACESTLRMTPCITHLVEDERLQEIFDKYAENRKKPLYKTIGVLLPIVVPFAVKDHKTDIYEIVSALTLKPVKEVGKMTLKELKAVLEESIDEEFISFFR